jgi:hypothetical protein
MVLESVGLIVLPLNYEIELLASVLRFRPRVGSFTQPTHAGNPRHIQP